MPSSWLGTASTEPTDGVISFGSFVEMHVPPIWARGTTSLWPLTWSRSTSFYANIARSLAPDGVFVLHTYPNRWFYERHHPRRRAHAAAMGCWLPPQPRSRYELIVHINEQDPPTVDRQLSAHFEHVITWVGDIPNPAGSLVGSWDMARTDSAPDIFAVASQHPIDVEALLARLHVEALEPADMQTVSVSTATESLSLTSGQETFVELEITNGSDRTLSSAQPRAVHASYRWLDSDGRPLVAEGQRTRLIPPVEAHGWARADVRVEVPGHLSGPCQLRLSLVQEGVSWFDRHGCYVDVPATIAHPQPVQGKVEEETQPAMVAGSAESPAPTAPVLSDGLSG